MRACYIFILNILSAIYPHSVISSHRCSPITHNKTNLNLKVLNADIFLSNFLNQAMLRAAWVFWEWVYFIIFTFFFAATWRTCAVRIKWTKLQMICNDACRPVPVKQEVTTETTDKALISLRRLYHTEATEWWLNEYDRKWAVTKNCCITKAKSLSLEEKRQSRMGFFFRKSVRCQNY